MVMRHRLGLRSVDAPAPDGHAWAPGSKRADHDPKESQRSVERRTEHRDEV